MIVPWQQVNADSLRNLVEEFVTRDGTDYGDQEVSLERKVAAVMSQLHSDKVVIWFDAATETVSLMFAEDVRTLENLSQNGDVDAVSVADE